MKTIYPLLVSALLFFSYSFQAQHNEKTQAIIWQNFSTNFNILGFTHYPAKPLQYNNELDLVSFVQRISPYYPSTPAPSPFAATGVVVGYLSSNWGASWDSTCIWSNNSYAARYPQGGVYNPSGNTQLSNAYLLGTGPCLDTTNLWIGNWSASKQLGGANYNTTASAQSNAQQMLSSFAPLPTFGMCYFSNTSFSSCDDGSVRTLAKLGQPNIPGGFRGAMVLKATFNNGVFTWTGDSLECPTHYNSPYFKVVDQNPLMAWNETGTTGYVVYIGSRDGGLASNFGMQPIVYKTTNSGATWQLSPGMDFNSPGAQNLKKYLPSVNATNLNPNLIIPNVISREGWDVVVDKNNNLHIACLINGAVSPLVDSLYNTHNYGSEGYDWQHIPGRRPYLVDFILSQNQTWTYGIVDSLSSEAPGSFPFSPGNGYNTWGLNGVTNLAKIQCSRTPEGRFVVITWAETDSSTSNPPLKWNRFPDLKARLIDTDTYGLSPTEINLSAGTNPNVSAAATMHFASPRCATATLSTNSFDIKLPVSISNNPGQLGLATSSNWFSAAELNFSNNTFPFTQSIPSYYVGLNETTAVENSFELFPNPFQSGFKIRRLNSSSEPFRIEVFDVTGRKLCSKIVEVSEYEMNASSLNAGAYVIRIATGQSVLHKKLIKE